jgi:hypothetical protein
METSVSYRKGMEDVFDAETGTLQSFAQFALKTAGEPFGILVMASVDEAKAVTR